MEKLDLSQPDASLSQKSVIKDNFDKEFSNRTPEISCGQVSSTPQNQHDWPEYVKQLRAGQINEQQFIALALDKESNRNQHPTKDLYQRCLGGC